MAEQTAVMEQHGTHHHPHLAHHFEDIQQQTESGTVGMWLFLATEIMLFGALFGAYTMYRFLYPQDFGAAQAELNVPLGAVNTAVLLCSSLTMALAVRAAQLGKNKITAWFLIATIILGLAFVGIKLVDWYEEYTHHLVPLRGFHFQFEGAEPPSGTRPDLLFQTEGSGQALEMPNAEPGIQPSLGSPESDLVTKAGRVKMFFTFYFIMTGLHALHMLIGVALVAWLVYRAFRNHFSPEYYAPVEIGGLYWHFVDIVWIFLFPVLYLI